MRYYRKEDSGSAALKNEKAKAEPMIEIPYSLIIEATKEPDYFGFYSPDLHGFSGIGHSIEDCLYKAKHGMKEHIELLRQNSMQIPPVNPNPRIIIENEKKQAVA